jgi:flagellar export protein FliJ
VLQVRKNREKEALAALGAAQRVYQQAQGRKFALQERLKQSLVDRERLSDALVSPISFQVENDFISGTKQRIIQADQAIVRASRGVEKALRAYLAARRQSRMIEVIEEKDFADFKRDAARKEQKSMDELVVMRARLREEEIA